MFPNRAAGRAASRANSSAKTPFLPIDKPAVPERSSRPNPKTKATSRCGDDAVSNANRLGKTELQGSKRAKPGTLRARRLSDEGVREAGSRSSGVQEFSSQR